MKTITTSFLFLALLISSPSFSIEPLKTWVDGNNLEWTMFPVTTNYWRAQHKCRSIGFTLPGEDDFFEAIHFGLLDKKSNTAFGTQASKIDWIWVPSDNTGMSYASIASRQGDVTIDSTDARHWVLCVRMHGN